MLFVLVPERNANGVIVARASVYIMYVTGNLAYFNLIKRSTFFFDNVRNMLRILHLTKYSNFDFIKFLKLN
jgi:hypothetical protein